MSISMGTVGAFAAFGMAFMWAVRGSPWLPIPLLPGYVPHAYKVVEWVVFYFVVLRPRFGLRAFPAFLAGYGALEVFFNVVYLAAHGGPQFGVYPYLDSQYPIRLAVYFAAFVTGVYFGRVKAGVPVKDGFVSLWRVVVVAAFSYDEYGAISAGYGTVSSSVAATAWTWPQVANDLFANSLYLLFLWAVLYPRAVIGPLKGEGPGGKGNPR